MTKPIDRNRLVALIEKFAASRRDGTVLVIDDDPDVRAMVKTTIDDVGMKATTVANGQAALDWLASHPQPVLVLRRVTERPEASMFGMAKIIGMSRETIVRETADLLTNEDAYLDMSEGDNPYGDGKATGRIIEACREFFERVGAAKP